MASSSPAEFLTFYRRVAMSQSLRRQAAARPQAVRSFRSSASARNNNSGVKTDAFPDDQHATQKTDRLDVQSREAGKGMQSKAQDTGGSATQQKDERDSVSRAKKDFPEAPTPAIGMQDERGGKGH